MKHFVVAFSAAFISLSLLQSSVNAAPAHPNLLTNGDFSHGPNPHGVFLTFAAKSKAIPGWTVTRATIDYVAEPFWAPLRAQRAIDLDGTPGFGGISQTFTTVPGKTYTVTFELSGNCAGPPAVKRLLVSAGGHVARYTFNCAGMSNSHMLWETHSLQFVARAKRATLEFDSEDKEDGRYGPALDYVKVTKA
jgi:choice-of-anchor C domain-containing protein